jgi:hypothetical protein
MVFAWSRPPESPRPLTQTALHEASLVFPEGASPEHGSDAAGIIPALLGHSHPHCSCMPIHNLRPHP